MCVCGKQYLSPHLAAHDANRAQAAFGVSILHRQQSLPCSLPPEVTTYFSSGPTCARLRFHIRASAGMEYGIAQSSSELPSLPGNRAILARAGANGIRSGQRQQLFLGDPSPTIPAVRDPTFLGSSGGRMWLIHVHRPHAAPFRTGGGLSVNQVHPLPSVVHTNHWAFVLSPSLVRRLAHSRALHERRGALANIYLLSLSAAASNPGSRSLLHQSASRRRRRCGWDRSRGVGRRVPPPLPPD